MLARQAFVATLLAVTPTFAVAQDPAERALPAGSWQGTLRVGPQSLELAFHLARRDGQLGGTMDSLSQQATGIPISAVEWDGKAIKITLDRIGGTFTGTLEEGDPPRLRGEWAQGPGRFPLELRAVDEVVVEKPDRPQHPEPPFPYRVEEVAYHYLPADGPEAIGGRGTGDSITLAGTLTLPEGDGPFPAVLLVTGSGPQDRDETLMGHKPFLVIADHLTRAGFAVLRYDDRGTGSSTGSHAGSTVLDFAADARAGLSFLRQDARIAKGAIGMAGHSEGGIVAPIVAAAHPDEVAFAVLIAAPSVPIDEIILHQQKLIATADGAAANAVEALDALSRRMFDAVRGAGGADDEAIDAAVAATWAELGEDLQAEIGSAEALRQQVDQLREPWMRHLLTHDPADALAGMRCPTLALFGSRDLQVDPEQNVAPMQTAFEKGGKVEPEIVVLEGHNHLFQRATTGSPSEYQQLTETFSPLALAAITDWLKGLELGR